MQFYLMCGGVGAATEEEVVVVVEAGDGTARERVRRRDRSMTLYRWTKSSRTPKSREQRPRAGSQLEDGNLKISDDDDDDDDDEGGEAAEG